MDFILHDNGMKLTTEPLQDMAPLLTNDGHLSLFFSGVGSSFSKNLFQTSFIIIKGKEHIMIDCGTLTPLVMDHIGLPIFNIDNLLITHAHADHAGGLEEMTLLQRYLKHKKPNLYITEAFSKLLWEDTLKGGIQFNEYDGKKFLEFEDMFNPIYPKKNRLFDRDGWQFQLGDMDIQLFRTRHIPDSAKSWKSAAWSTGLVIDHKILFTGDSQFDRDLFSHPYFTENIETVFHDCQFKKPGGVHASLEELKDLPADIKSKIHLIHYADDWQKHEQEVMDSGFAGFTRRWEYYNFNE